MVNVLEKGVREDVIFTLLYCMLYLGAQEVQPSLSPYVIIQYKITTTGANRASSVIDYKGCRPTAVQSVDKRGCLT